MYVLAIGVAFSDEIVKLREFRAANPNAEPPVFEDPGFRALVEENVKQTVRRIARSTVMTDVSIPSFPVLVIISSRSKKFLGPLSLLIDDPTR